MVNQKQVKIVFNTCSKCGKDETREHYLLEDEQGERSLYPLCKKCFSSVKDVKEDRSRAAKRSAAVRRAKAKEHGAEAYKFARDARNGGKFLNRIAEELNAKGFRSSRGNKYGIQTTSKLLNLFEGK